MRSMRELRCIRIHAMTESKKTSPAKTAAKKDGPKKMSPLDALAKLASKRKPPAPAKAPAPAPQMSLDLWPNAVRGVPNAILRSALFSVMKDRPAVTRELLASVDNVQIVFTGIRLNQKDLDYYEELLHLQRMQPLGEPIRFTASAFLKSMGQGVGKYQYDELKDVIARLGANKTEVVVNKKNVFGRSLIEKFDRDDETQEYLVLLSPLLMKLFDDGYTQVDWAQRHALGKNMLAKALHGLYATHAAPYPVKVDTIRKLTGSTTKDLSKFRQQLRAALTAMQKVGSLLEWEIDKRDLVHVKKVATLSQQRHLLKKRLGIKQ